MFHQMAMFGSKGTGILRDNVFGRGEEQSFFSSFLCKVTAENEKSTICGGQDKKSWESLASQPEEE